MRPSFDFDLPSSILFGGSALAALYHQRRQKKPLDRPSKSLDLVRYLSDDSNHSRAWESYHDEDELFVQGFPKIELHVHLDGTFDPDFLFRYMQEHPDSIYCLPVASDLPWEPGRKLPVRAMVQECETSRDYHQLCTCRGYRSLKAMLNCFEIFLPLVRGNLELMEQLAFDFCQRQWEQHCVYSEVRYSPHLLAEGFEIGNDGKTTNESGPERVFQAVTKGLRRGCKQFDITVNQILCGIAWRPEWAMSTLDLAKKYRNDFPCAAVGVDIAAGEEHFDEKNFPHLYQPHFDMIQEAKKCNVPITLHAGESTDLAQENVRQAILKYGASRIGHGYRMVESPELMKLVKDSQCHVEVCPTSSDETGGWQYEEKDWSRHPCVTMLDHGVSLSLSSDDPAVFHTSLAWQYRTGLAKIGLTRQDIIQSNLDAIDAAFCPEEQKVALRERVKEYARKNPRHPYRHSISDNFADRVYLSAKQYV